jgi:hypothetical protein
MYMLQSLFGTFRLAALFTAAMICSSFGPKLNPYVTSYPSAWQKLS